MRKNKSGNNNGLNQYQSPSFYNQQTFPAPGQFQPPPPAYPPPFGNPPTYNGTQKPPHNYRGWVLAIFIICFVFSWVAIGAETMALSGIPSSSDTSSTNSGVLSGFATILFIVVNIGIVILDGRSFFSLFGRIRWRRLKGWQKAVLGILYLCGAIMPGIYVFFALQNFRRISQQTVGQSVGSWYQSKSKNSRIGIIVVSLLSVIFFAIITGSMASYDRSQAFLALTPTATAQQITQSNNPTATTASQDTGTTPTAIPTVTATPKPSPTHQPTPTHIAQPTPKPTPRPTQPPPTLAITFTCASAVDYSYGRVCVHTLSGAALTITVTYCSGYDATSASLQGTVYANGSGNYEWDWTPQTKCRGSATASVNANWNGQSSSNADNFNVG